MTDKERFAQLLEQPVESFHIDAGVGTLSEKYLHALLKNFFEPDRDHHEVRIDRYTADICRDMDIVEIQTRSLDKLRAKLEYYLLEGYSVKVVYPIPRYKWITWVDPVTGETTKKRRSSKTGSFFDCFWELYKIKYFLDWEKLSVELVLLDVEDLKSLNGYGKSRKRYAQRMDRVPVSLVDTLVLKDPKDYFYFVPEGLGDLFTASEYSRAAKMHIDNAYTALGILCYMNVLEVCGKDGRRNIYRRCL